MSVVEFEAAEDLVDVPGVQKPVASHHHLEALCDKSTGEKLLILFSFFIFFFLQKVDFYAPENTFRPCRTRSRV